MEKLPALAVPVEQYLLKGPMPELSKMSKKELVEECQMWRNVWSWVPDEVKYYVARTPDWTKQLLAEPSRLLPLSIRLLQSPAWAERTTNRHNNEKLQTIPRHTIRHTLEPRRN